MALIRTCIQTLTLCSKSTHAFQFNYFHHDFLPLHSLKECTTVVLDALKHTGHNIINNQIVGVACAVDRIRRENSLIATRPYKSKNCPRNSQKISLIVVN